MASFGLTSCLEWSFVDFFSVRIGFLQRTKYIYSLRKRDFFCEPAHSLASSRPLCSSIKIKITASLRFLQIRNLLLKQNFEF